MGNSETRHINILLVDDDEIDVRAFRRALGKQSIAHTLYIARDGIEALEHLRGENIKMKINRPLLIFVDLNMPRMTGIQFLQSLRTDAKLHDNIVFVLTTSNSEQDIRDAYSNYVAGYFIKSKIDDQFLEVMGIINGYIKSIEFPMQSRA